MAGSLPPDGASSLKTPQSHIPVQNKMSEFTLPQTIDEYVEIGDKTDDVFSEIRAQFHPAFLNLGQLSEELDISNDVEAEFESAVSEYFATKQERNVVCAEIRAQFHPANWNRSELSE